MKFIADFHIHSPFSRATSPDLSFESLSVWGALKGVTLIGTGDCTHPGWLKKIRESLEDAEQGLYKLKDPAAAQKQMPLAGFMVDPVRFIITGEISTIYKRDGKTRKVHHVVMLPSLAAAQTFAQRLGAIGNVRSDGRPILGLDSRDLLEILLESSPAALLVPAHIWTPWFSVLGSKSGFDAIEECYRDLSGHIYALETGLSSDPAMNWMVSSLDKYTLISNSDAHSANKVGREATIFNCDLSYKAISRALQHKSEGGFGGTLEFFPEEGKYHYDGHRSCNVCFTPEQSRKANGICPVCGKPLTLGVDYRVTELADHPHGRKPADAPPFYSMLGLAEIIGELLDAGSASQKVQQLYFATLASLGSEMSVLLDTDLAQVKNRCGELLAEAIDRMRKSAVHTKSGYDGEYGVITAFTPQELKDRRGQLSLFQNAFSETTTVKKSREPLSLKKKSRTKQKSPRRKARSN